MRLPGAHSFYSSGLAAERKAAVPTPPRDRSLTNVAGTLGSLVAAPGLMIVQKAAIKSLGGGGSRKTQLSRSGHHELQAGAVKRPWSEAL